MQAINLVHILIFRALKFQITMEAHFIKDLGLDSLDVVEIIMAFEEELSMLL